MDKPLNNRAWFFLVPVLVFVTLQRYFVQGLTAGSVGG